MFCFYLKLISNKELQTTLVKQHRATHNTIIVITQITQIDIYLPRVNDIDIYIAQRNSLFVEAPPSTPIEA